MKFRHILFLAGAVAASASFADTYHPSNAEEGVSLHQEHASSGLTRAQVNTTVMGAQRDGTLSWISRGYPGTYPLVAGPNLSKSRQQVLGELAAWQRNPVTFDGLREVGGEIGWADARQAR
jgi:hypothetical protein